MMAWRKEKIEDLRFDIRVDGKIGFINYLGEEIILPIYTPAPGAAGLSDFADGVVWVSKSGRYLALDIDGNELFICNYHNVCTFGFGVCKVLPRSSQGRGLSSYNESGYRLIDKTGKFVLDPIYNNIFPFYKSFTKVVKNGLCGLLDENYNTVLPCFYKDVFVVNDETQDRYIFAEKSGGKNKRLAAFDLNGKQLTDFVFEDVGHSIEQDRLAFKSEGLFGYLDSNLNIVIKPKYDQVDDFADGYARVTAVSSKKGFIDREGNEVIATRLPGHKTYTLSEGRVATLDIQSQLMGYLNLKEEWAIAPQFDEASHFVNGRAIVKKGDQCACIDTTGHHVVPYGKYDDLKLYNLRHGFIQMEKETNSGVLDLHGYEILPPIYRSVGIQKGVLIKTETGYFNAEGECVWSQPILPEPDISFESIPFIEVNYSELKKRANLLKFSFGKSLQEKVVDDLEHQYGFKIPVEYRQFLQHVGNGGPGPLEELYELKEAVTNTLRDLDDPTDLTRPFVPSVYEPSHKSDYRNKPGILYIGTDHVVYTIGLVVSGAEYGTVWLCDCKYWFPYTEKFWHAVKLYHGDFDLAADHIVKHQAEIPRMNFYQWYMSWLNREEQW